MRDTPRAHPLISIHKHAHTPQYVRKFQLAWVCVTYGSIVLQQKRNTIVTGLEMSSHKWRCAATHRLSNGACARRRMEHHVGGLPSVCCLNLYKLFKVRAKSYVAVAMSMQSENHIAALKPRPDVLGFNVKTEASLTERVPPQRAKSYHSIVDASLMWAQRIQSLILDSQN